jgi:ABC-type multidrug transport system fused ATPase/permease subunit
MTAPVTTSNVTTSNGSGSRRFGAKNSVGMIRVLRDTFAAVGPNKGSLWLLIFFSVISGVVESALLFLVARLALGTTSGSETVDVSFGPIPETDLSINTTLVIATAVLIASLAFSYPVAKLAGRLSRRTLIRLRKQLARRYLESPWAERSADPEGHLQELMSEFCQRNERVVAAGTQIIVAGVSILALVISAVFVAPLGSLILIVGLLLLAAGVRPIAKRVKRGSSQLAATNKGLSSQVAQTSRVSQEIAAFDVAAPVAATLNDRIEASGRFVGQVRFAANLMPTVYQSAALGLILLMVGVLSATSSEGVGNVAPVLLLFVRTLGYGRQIQTQTQKGVEVSPYVDALEEEIQALIDRTPPRPTEVIDRFDGMTFRDVSFEYQPGRPVLTDVDLEIEPGSAVGLVGPSGAGKSTLMQLILGLRRPTEGDVRVNGVSIGDIAPECWASVMSFVPQDNKLIRGTVAENIAFYRDGFSADDIEAAGRAAHLHDEIMAFPEGYDTPIGPGQRDLSGGQRQRLGIARAVVARPMCLVLDEPTSALDDRSERLVRQTLQEIKAWTTLIVIAHRPGILEVCDHLVKVEHGHVVLETTSPVG